MIEIERSTQAVLERFAELSRIPRPSRREERVLAWLKQWADGRGFSHRSDAAGNLCVRVPASPGREQIPSTALQAHVDMVCEKTPESKHDFLTDPIVPIQEGEWLRADGTTLGADNGLAVAIIMALADSKESVHPPLELLFTVDEETGLNGALALDPSLLSSRRLLNLDSEDEGVFTIGCAGGSGAEGSLHVDRAPASGMRSLRVNVGGLQGGHSGVDIHIGRANALCLLAEALEPVDGKALLRAIEGGQAHNAIPRFAAALLAAPQEQALAVFGAVQDRLLNLKRQWRIIEPEMTAIVEFADVDEPEPLTMESSLAAMRLIRDLPHGVQARDPNQQGLVETSANLARVRLDVFQIEIAVSQRSIHMDRLGEINARVASIFAAHHARVRVQGGYPSWSPDFNSPLLADCRRIYEKMFGRPPKIEVIHAGLECGVIGARIPGIDMISFGPTIRHPHSPSERAHLPSVGRVWDFTLQLLAEMG